MAKTEATIQETGSERLVDKIARERRRRRLLTLFLVILAGLMMMTFLMAMFIDKTGNFTITMDAADRGKGLSLYATYDDLVLGNGTSGLSAEKLKDLTNITLPWMDVGEIDKSKGGSQHGEDSAIEKYNTWFAFTFYVGNPNEDYTYKYVSQLRIKDTAKGMDEAVRAILIDEETGYFMGEGITKRRTRVFGKKSKTEGVIDPFITDESCVFTGKTVNEEERTLPPGMAHKYTLIIYLEGEDPECIDNLYGGFIKMSMSFGVLDAYTA